jgi:hypothetical protein
MTWDERLLQEGYAVVDGVARRRPTMLPPGALPARQSQQRRGTEDEEQRAYRPRYRSKTEARYAQVLATRMVCQEVVQWWYEPLSLRLGIDCHYRPDFMVQRPGTALLHLVEVKGTWIRDRALDKVRAAATRFPCYVFTLAVWDGRAWTETRIGAHP